MPFRLVHRYGHPNRWMFYVNFSQTKSDALNEARNRIASGDQGAFLIERDDGRIVVNDSEVAAYCGVLCGGS